MKQLTKKQAIALFDSKAWESWTHEQRAALQLHQERLCMPFSVFHEAVETALGRAVWTHELGLNRQRLQDELAGRATAPTIQEIIDLLPKDKTIVVVADEGG